MTPPPSYGSPPSSSAYERMVFERAAAEVADYCAAVRAALSPAERSALRVTVHLYTDRDVGDVKRRIREHAAQAFDVELDGARLDALYHDIDPSLPAPGFRVVIPRNLGAPTTDPGGDPVPDGSITLRLTLVYATDLRLEYRLRSLDTWLGLGRLLPSAGKYVPVEVPRGVVAVPRGRLLMIRYHARLMQLWRTAERPEYRVVVDGRPLLPQQQPVACGEHGTIEYRHTAGNGQSSIIRYHAVEEG
ncbi:hypothetical protein GA0074692_3850 [Micromonospora pallida]|uniref:Uncharacterized protein n=1 Tax=Micromonospora pallida TaxID=145854 RepID=A0A1C6SYW7_9ACTN|nr:hypothetical protein [Micromonospora pallida]SCL34512.1 hypothetical protein GA0074692_3850 [Micromonospora pallida]